MMMMKKVIVLCCLFFLSITIKTVYADDGINCTMMVPNKIDYGSIRVVNDSSEMIVIECNNGFKAYPSNMIPCSEFNATATNTAPTCIKTCSSVAPTRTATPTCKFRNANTSCEQPYENSVAIFQCMDEYHENRDGDVRIFTCRHGKWTKEPHYECEPVCGMRNATAQELLIGGAAAKRHEFPWHLGIFKSAKNICGGVLITARIALSAAHCFKHDADPKLYQIAGGKVYRDLTHPLDTHVQYRNLLNISTPTEYYSEGDSRNDLAILLLDKPFTINAYIQPACIDTNRDFKNDQLLAANPGLLTGWGYTAESNSPSEYLKVLDVYYKSRAQCTLRFDFKKYYFPSVHDKICAGHFKKGLSACRGDSGGGLVFQSTSGRYIVRGIVSITPTYQSGCDSNQFTLYTSIAYHMDFIEKEMNKFQQVTFAENRINNYDIEYSGGCIVPTLKNGHYVGRYYHVGKLIMAGSIVPAYTEMNVECDHGFHLLGRRERIICINNTYLDFLEPTKIKFNYECRQLCPDVYNEKTFNMTCFYNDARVTCDYIYDGVTVNIPCKSHYKKISDSDDPYRYCLDGTWNDAFPFCKPSCGKKFDKEIIDNNTNHFDEKRRDRFPWHVLLFNTWNNKYICAGTLIEPDIVVTTDCFKYAGTLEVITYNGRSVVNYLGIGYNYIKNLFKLRIDWQEINHFVQPICNPFEVSYFYYLNQEGYFITTNGNDYNLENVSFEIVQVIFRGSEYCIPDLDEKRVICMELIGNPKCDNIVGSGIIYPEDGLHFIIGMIDDRTNCSDKFTTGQYFSPIEPDIKTYLNPL